MICELCIFVGLYLLFDVVSLLLDLIGVVYYIFVIWFYLIGGVVC